MHAASSISLRGLSFRYEGPFVLEGVDLDVPAGGFHSLIGPSGCGKSTLLRLVAGLLDADAGQVLIDGHAPVVSSGDTGFIFQEPTLMPWLTVRENIALPLRLRGRDRKKRSTAAEELAGRVGLRDFLDYYPRELSGGMKMRVSLARALALSPRLMLLDEPFAGLDAIRRDQLNEALLDVQQQEGWTALLVTHSVAEAVFLSSRVSVMSLAPGRIVRSFDIPLPFPRTAELRSEPAFQALVGEVLACLREVLPL